MPTINGDAVPYGLDHVVPTTARTAWGARLIVDQDGYVDFVPDRHGFAGEDRELMLTTLNEEFPLGDLTSAIAMLLHNGEMHTREAKDFVIHYSERLEVHANTNASAGYCYVTAWLKADQQEESRQVPTKTYPIYKSDQYAVTRQGSSIIARELITPELATVEFDGDHADRFESELKSFQTRELADLYLSSYFGDGGPLDTERGKHEIGED